MADAFLRSPALADYRIRYARGSDRIVETLPAPSSEDVAAGVVLFEQIDARRFPGLAQLPEDCKVVRFPSLDTNLLWPFGAINPYDAPGPHDPEGRCPFGDRVLLRCIELGWDEDRIVDYYRDDYAAFRVDLRRVAAIERARVEARDAGADVRVADLVSDLVSEALFWANNHPRARLVAALAARLASAAADAVPELANFSTPPQWSVDHDARWELTAVPVHPGVAAELGLPWYDPHATYSRSDGSRMTQVDFVRDFVRWSLRNRALQLEQGTASMHDPVRWHPPIEGPLRIVGPAVGIYPDAFAAPQVRFELEAIGPVEELGVHAYLPPQHRAPATVVCAFGASKAEAVMEPGTPFTLTLRLRLGAGERARFSMTCSQTLNMFERGESADNRDLGVLILGMRAS